LTSHCHKFSQHSTLNRLHEITFLNNLQLNLEICSSDANSWRQASSTYQRTHSCVHAADVVSLQSQVLKSSVRATRTHGEEQRPRNPSACKVERQFLLHYAIMHWGMHTRRRRETCRGKRHTVRVSARGRRVYATGGARQPAPVA
jgi:hypothetical protein